MSTSHSPQQNRLLAALPPAEFGALAAQLELVPLPLGTMLNGPGRPMGHAYFPTTAIVSLQYVLTSGAMTETASVGNEGMVGISLFMGGGAMPNSAVVHTAGHAYRLGRHTLMQEFNRAASLQRLLLRYTQMLMTQICQTAGCNRHHTIEQQLCRWLLLTLDRVPSRELVITQELIAGMLGVRRESITEAAGRLQRAGLIRYRRGHIVVVDRHGLEAHACECYNMMRNELSRPLNAA